MTRKLVLWGFLVFYVFVVGATVGVAVERWRFSKERAAIVSRLLEEQARVRSLLMQLEN